ncbi:hypothetical protein GCM10020367_46050 [Streptomyces sannanensis]|uniref:Uncharacterized protein n=1 Tax=Streptomyces sannanensis TaxID=285536 RepID=A0ABP6SGT3_9ACTN
MSVESTFTDPLAGAPLGEAVLAGPEAAGLGRELPLPWGPLLSPEHPARRRSAAAAANSAFTG